MIKFLPKAIMFFLIILLVPAVLAEISNQKKPISAYSHSIYICFPSNLTIQDSIAECLIYTIYGEDNPDKENIKWLNQGISFHIIFKNEVYDLGIRNISYDKFDEIENRIKKTTYNIDDNGNNQTTYYISENFIQTRYTNGTILNETYIYANGKLLAKKDNSNNKQYHHPDHLGSTTLVTNQTGDIIEEEFYLPYGDIYFGNEESRVLNI